MKETSPSVDAINEAVAINSNALTDDKAGSPEDRSAQTDGMEHHEELAEQSRADETLEEKTSEHRSKYSDDGFWKKTTKYAKKAGEKTLSPALRLYYSAQDSDTPTWAKTTIYGALGYFISPVDALPDITPALGYTDDIGILAGAIAVVAAHIKDEHSNKAKETLKRWFN
ncbi:YkvA family protein [Modicisalibacter luteus]|uniref:YkvA family protein n=1 Tax=Modicisalibacter luteus TaxID=453962 RepID=A0ABV7M5F1_9GAMM|nr:YkvA family protein [Halomonas lutea]GHB07980.1 hypothetical protein GCM10007159_32530 [Halomonas lutea]